MFHKLMKCTCSEKWGDIGPLALRIALGAIFLVHGYDKVFVKGTGMIAGFLGSLGLPAPELFAYILSYGELITGALLILGLCTHWASKFAIVVAAGAFLFVHYKNGFWVGQGGYEFVMLIVAAGLSLMITGAGKYSLDKNWLHLR